MDEDPAATDHQPDERDREEMQRELDELLQEIRVALPGVQILFAFLLTICFTDIFLKMDVPGKAVYLIALILSAVTSVLFIAPTALHRLQHRHVRLDTLIRDATVLSVFGTATMGGALTMSTYLVARVGYSSAVSASVGVGIGLFTFVLWFVLPLARRSANARDSRR